MRFIALFPDGVLRYYLCRYPRAAEKYHAAALRNQRPQIVLHACFLRFGMCSFIL